MVRIHPDPPRSCLVRWPSGNLWDPGMTGGLAQLGEHLLCKQGVVGSIPSSSTKQHQATPKRLRKRLLCCCLQDCLESIGCSLTIHRVESALLAETASWRTVPLTTYLIASNE